MNKNKDLFPVYTSCRGLDLKLTIHYQSNCLAGRPVTLDGIAEVLQNPAYTSVQSGGTIEYFGFPSVSGKALEVVMSDRWDGPYWPIVTAHPFTYRRTHRQKAGLPG